MESKEPYSGACPIPIQRPNDRILLAHGEGARPMREFIRDEIAAKLMSEAPAPQGDAAVVDLESRQAVVTSDSFVVSPLFFPGGDIGTLAVYGTVNDLAVAGAIPRFLTLSFILEEGLPMELFREVMRRLASAAQAAKIVVVGGDTKVVPRGAADGLFIHTTGIGDARPDVNKMPVGPQHLDDGMRIIVSGPLGRHGMAVMCAREGMELDPGPSSDCCCLFEPINALLEELGPKVVCLRDATRGGASAVLHEWAEACGRTLVLQQSQFPHDAAAHGACELLGIDPLFVANEGTMLVGVHADAVDAALRVLRRFPSCRQASVVGDVVARGWRPVTIRRLLGPEQPLDEPSGAPLPRIC